MGGLKFLKIKETCLYVPDLEQVRYFYQEILELPVIAYLPGKHLFLQAGSSVLLLFNPDDSSVKQSPPPHYAHGKQHFALEVKQSDYEKTKMRIRQKGIRIIEEVEWPLGGKSFYFEDPAGNVIEIVPDRGIWPEKPLDNKDAETDSSLS
jgi:catechol 2,3-dioxygenase-like lactoylglutathione lyase family enzyme